MVSRLRVGRLLSQGLRVWTVAFCIVQVSPSSHSAMLLESLRYEIIAHWGHDPSRSAGFPTGNSADKNVSVTAGFLAGGFANGLSGGTETNHHENLSLPTAADGTLSAPLSNMTVAMPVLQERISPVLDTAARLLVVKHRRGKEVQRKEFLLRPLPPETLAHSVAELHVDLLLCAALSEGLHRALEQRGIRVRPHLCGPVEAILKAHCCGQLDREEFRMPGCWGHHLGGYCSRDRRTSRSGITRRTATRRVT